MDQIGPYTNELNDTTELDHMHETTWINLNHHHMDEIVLLVINDMDEIGSHGWNLIYKLKSQHKWCP
jgi:hypothetical protein